MLEFMMRGENLAQKKRARSLRANATRAEAILWKRLSNRQIGGFKFVRQEPIGPYFVDFVCRSQRLVIEIDGETHSTHAELRSDAVRSQFLERVGYRVQRFNNDDVFHAMQSVLETILHMLAPLPLTPSLSPLTGRGGVSAQEI